MAIPVIPSTISVPVLAPMPASQSSPSGPGAFQAIFENAVEQVNQLRNEANTSVQQFLAGEGGELHEVALATQKAELAFEMFQQVRNKMVQAYQEVMRMQL